MCLIPGLGGGGRFWSGVVERLHRVAAICPDHRGAGESDRPEGPYSIPLLARDVLALLDHLGHEHVTLVGHSTGGMIAQTIATMAPKRVSRLVLSGTWERPDQRFRRLFTARMMLLRDSGPEAYHRLTQALGYDNDWLDANLVAMETELALAAARLAPTSVQLARMQMLLVHDCFDALPQIPCPTLVLGARDDALIPFAHAERLAARIPNARLTELRGGHFYPRAYPAEFAAALTQFLEDTA